MPRSNPRLARTLILPAVATLLVAGCSEGGPATSPLGPIAATSQPSAERSSDAPAPPRTFTQIDVPGATATFPLDINALGVISGRYGQGGRTHGFVRSATGVFSTIDVPGSVFTVAAGINRQGDVVGMYALPGALNRRHGYLLHDGVFTTIDPAGSNWTNILGINARGDIVGRFCTKPVCGKTGTGDYHGFLRRDGRFTTLDVPASRETNAWKITDRRQIVGSYGTVDAVSHLFVRRGTHYATIDLPGGRPISQDNGGMNSLGDIVGIYCDFSPCEIVAAGTHGYILHRRVLTSIDYPGAKATGLYGINARGDVAGAYFDAAGKAHGFVSPGVPAPSDVDQP